MLVDIIVGQLVVPVSWQLRFRKLSTVHSTRGLLVFIDAYVYVFGCVAWHTHTRLFYFLIIGVGRWTCLLIIFVIAVLVILLESRCCCCYALILLGIVNVVIWGIVEIGFRVSGGSTLWLLRSTGLATFLTSSITSLGWGGNGVTAWFTLDHNLLRVNDGVNVVFASTNGSLSILTCQSV